MKSLRAFVKPPFVPRSYRITSLLNVVFQVWSNQEWLLNSMKAFAIYEATRRNSDLLSAAAAFPKPTEVDRTASLDAYMRITGVVKDRVVCHPRDDGRTQLDDLSEDGWQMVRRFLLLDDVEEAVTHP
ncbi:hypothetical protein MTO96_034992 [Rhipicephalus appendiculatus]